MKNKRLIAIIISILLAIPVVFSGMSYLTAVASEQLQIQQQEEVQMWEETMVETPIQNDPTPQPSEPPLLCYLIVGRTAVELDYAINNKPFFNELINEGIRKQGYTSLSLMIKIDDNPMIDAKAGLPVSLEEEEYILDNIEKFYLQENTYTLYGKTADYFIYIEGAEVLLKHTSHDGYEEIVGVSYSDEFGNFSFSGLKPGEYTLIVSAEGYYTATRSINLSEDRSEYIELHPMNFATILGDVIDINTNQPIEGAVVYAVSVDNPDISGYTTTNEFGHFLFCLIPGNYNLSVYADGYDTMTQSVYASYNVPIVSFYLLPDYTITNTYE